MFTAMAHNMVSCLIQQKVIEEDDREIYEYGAELIFSAVANTLILFLIAGVLHRTWEAACFSLGFLGLRGYVGGFHASSHARCILCFSLLVCCLFLFIHLTPESRWGYFSALSLGISWLLHFTLKRTAHVNRPITNEEAKVFRKRGHILLVLLTGICLVLVNIRPGLTLALTFGMLTVYGLVIIDLLQDFFAAREKGKEDCR